MAAGILLILGFALAVFCIGYDDYNRRKRILSYEDFYKAVLIDLVFVLTLYYPLAFGLYLIVTNGGIG